jgi:hypothetical protein
VVLVGRLELATEDDFARMLYEKMPEPWLAGTGTCSYGCGVTTYPDGG